MFLYYFSLNHTINFLEPNSKFPIFLAFFKLTDILCVNETEAMIFAGYESALDSFNTEKEIENVLEVLLKKCDTVIITLGKNGAAYATKQIGLLKST